MEDYCRKIIYGIVLCYLYFKHFLEVRPEEEQKLNTLTYGWRFPILGMFPNIVSYQYNKSNKNDNTKIIEMIYNTSLEKELADGKFC